MADALSTWTRTQDPTTNKVDFCAEASELGMKPGEHPGSRSLPEGRFALSYQWRNIVQGGDFVGWIVTLSNGTYTIFND